MVLSMVFLTTLPFCELVVDLFCPPRSDVIFLSLFFQRQPRSEQITKHTQDICICIRVSPTRFFLPNYFANHSVVSHSMSFVRSIHAVLSPVEESKQIIFQRLNEQWL